MVERMPIEIFLIDLTHADWTAMSYNGVNAAYCFIIEEYDEYWSRIDEICNWCKQFGRFGTDWETTDNSNGFGEKRKQFLFQKIEDATLFHMVWK